MSQMCRDACSVLEFDGRKEFHQWPRRLPVPTHWKPALYGYFGQKSGVNVVKKWFTLTRQSEDSDPKHPFGKEISFRVRGVPLATVSRSHTRPERVLTTRQKKKLLGLLVGLVGVLLLPSMYCQQRGHYKVYYCPLQVKVQLT